MEHHQSAVVPGDHPSFAGHFPGNPIVPGVLLLDWVAAAIIATASNRPRLRLSAAPNIKFLSPLLPGDHFDIYWTPISLPATASSRFRCEARGQIVAQGTLSFAAIDDAARPADRDG